VSDGDTRQVLLKDFRVTFATVLLLGCQASSSYSDRQAAPSDSSIELSRFPVDAEWRVTEEWASPARYNELSYDLWQEAIRVCMMDQGHAYTPIEYVDFDEQVPALNPLNEEIALRVGYGDPPLAGPVDLNLSRSPGFGDALFQNPNCVEKARLFVFGAPASAEMAASQAALIDQVDGVVIEFETTNEYAAGLDRWARCMEAAGYEYRSPAEARREFGGPNVDDGEVDTRLADLDCDKRVGLTESRSRFQQAALQTWKTERALELAQLSALREAAERELGDLAGMLRLDGVGALPAADSDEPAVESTPPTSAG
jgi:hypothetical protein